MPENALPGVVRRFLRYVRIDTQADPHSERTPSTEKQKDLGRLLAAELRDMGYADAEMDEWGYVFATIPSTLSPAEAAAAPTVALLAHMDTSFDAPGAGVEPIVHPPYDGGIVALPGAPGVVLDPERSPALKRHLGQRLITSDGTTLLGSDDKAGVAVLMQLAEDLRASDAPRPRLRLCFTVDEEIGRGVDKLDLDKLGADVAYTLDGSDRDMLYAETFNAAEATIRVRGVMVHPGYARGVLVNAVRIVSELVGALPHNEAPETTDGRQGYFHPHRIWMDGPAETGVQLILRDFTDEGMARRKAYVAQLVDTFRLRYPDAEIALEVKDQYKNMRAYIEDVDPRAITFAHAAAREMGFELGEEEIRGGTDGSRLSELGLPTPNVFNGGHDYHSVFEWNTVENLERSLDYTHALVRYWGEHGHEEA